MPGPAPRVLAAVERPASLVDRVADAIRREIGSGNFPRSSRLPPEGVLAAEMSVSRTVVREAISQLRSDGVLVSRKGSGVYVSETPEGNVFRVPLPGAGSHDVAQLFELRRAAETSAAEIAALRRTPQDLLRLEAALEAMDANADDLVVAAATDVDFHAAVAAATHNAYFQALVSLLRRQMHESRRVAWLNSARFADGHRPAQREHAAILRAIRRRDPAAARKAALDHLAAAARRMRLDLPDASTRRRARRGP